MRKTGYLLCADSQLLQQREKLFPFFLRKRGEKSRELFSAGVFHFMPAFLPCFCQGNQHDPFIPFVSASEDKAIIFQLCKLLRKGLRTNGKMVCQCSLTYGLPFADKPKDTFPRKRRWSCGEWECWRRNGAAPSGGRSLPVSRKEPCGGTCLLESKRAREAGKCSMPQGAAAGKPDSLRLCAWRRLCARERSILYRFSSE